MRTENGDKPMQMKNLELQMVACSALKPRAVVFDMYVQQVCAVNLHTYINVHIHIQSSRSTTETHTPHSAEFLIIQRELSVHTFVQV